MSNYKNIRSKKNADLVGAMANVRKDLYDWKQMENSLKINGNVGSIISSSRHSSLDSGSSSLFKMNNFPKTSVPNINNAKLRPLSNTRVNKLSDFNNDIDLIDMDQDENENSNRNDGSRRINLQGNDRIYLNSPRNNQIKSSRKSLEQLEEEIVNKNCLIFSLLYSIVFLNSI